MCFYPLKVSYWFDQLSINGTYPKLHSVHRLCRRKRGSGEVAASRVNRKIMTQLIFKRLNSVEQSKERGLGVGVGVGV